MKSVRGSGCSEPGREGLSGLGLGPSETKLGSFASAHRPLQATSAIAARALKRACIYCSLASLFPGPPNSPSIPGAVTKYRDPLIPWTPSRGCSKGHSPRNWMDFLEISARGSGNQFKLVCSRKLKSAPRPQKIRFLFLLQINLPK